MRAERENQFFTVKIDAAKKVFADTTKGPNFDNKKKANINGIVTTIIITIMKFYWVCWRMTDSKQRERRTSHEWNWGREAPTRVGKTEEELGGDSSSKQLRLY